MNQFPNPRVRGGFSPLNGLGALDEFGNPYGNALPPMQTIDDPANHPLSSIPTWAYVMGGLAFVAIFMLPPSYRR